MLFSQAITFKPEAEQLACIPLLPMSHALLRGADFHLSTISLASKYLIDYRPVSENHMQTVSVENSLRL